MDDFKKRYNLSQFDSWNMVKRFLIIFLPLFALISGTVAALYYTEVKKERNNE